MATTIGSDGLETIPEEGSYHASSYWGGERQIQSQTSVTSSNTSSTSNAWSTIRKLVKKHSLQLVGLEHSDSIQCHQDAVQRSIVVGRMSKDLQKDPSSQQSIQPSLVRAIIPHETVSPVITHQLLHQISQISIRSEDQSFVSTSQQPPSATSTPLDTSSSKQRGNEYIELDTIKPKTLASSSSEPSLPLSTGTFPKKRPPNLEHSFSLPTDIPPTSYQPYSFGEGTLSPAYLNKPTGRAQSQDLTETDTKPDLWKIAYYGIKFISKSKKSIDEDSIVTNQKLGKQMSFQFEYEEEPIEEDLTQFRPTLQRDSSVVSDNVDSSYQLSRQQQYELMEDEDFFGHEVKDYNDGTITRQPLSYISKTDPMITIPELDEVEDERPPPYSPSYLSRPSHKYSPTHITKRSTARKQTGHLYNPFKSKQYRPPVQVLGGFTLNLLNFKYKHVHSCTRQKLDELEKKAFHRPFFTYWLMTVHVINMIFALAVYGFAPYGFDQFTERALVQQSNLAVEVEERIIIPNVWGGPPQTALVRLGATYGPCMRRDNQLYEGINGDVVREYNDSGCCVRKDQSGCVQVLTRNDCPVNFADFIYIDSQVNTSIEDFTNRAVCGTSPRTCVNPDPTRDSRWKADRITDWPICLESQTLQNSSSHLRCNLTGRPCCVGIQAHCLITTQEHCEFLEGRFHQDAFLCAQVDCLDDICGLLPFLSMNQPDQFYRLWTALFLHAGIIHLVFTLVFHFLVLRHVEKYLGWFRTVIIYIGSGIGGNLVSIIFIPYNPEVGPAGGIFGIIAFFLIYIMYQAHRLEKAWLEALKLGIVVVILIGCGLFPFIDNFAHFGGFVFGILLSGIFVPYYQPKEAEREYYKNKHGHEYSQKTDWIQISKYMFLCVGIPLLVVLYILFLVLFYVVQDTAWNGFQYLNCIPFTSTFCLDFGRNIRSRNILY